MSLSPLYISINLPIYDIFRNTFLYIFPFFGGGGGAGLGGGGEFTTETWPTRNFQEKEDEEEFLALAQVADICKILREAFKTEEDWVSKVQAEIRDNQKKIKCPPHKQKISNGSLWRDRHFYYREGAVKKKEVVVSEVMGEKTWEIENEEHPQSKITAEMFKTLPEAKDFWLSLCNPTQPAGTLCRR